MEREPPAREHTFRQPFGGLEPPQLQPSLRGCGGGQRAESTESTDRS